MRSQRTHNSQMNRIELGLGSIWTLSDKSGIRWARESTRKICQLLPLLWPNSHLIHFCADCSPSIPSPVLALLNGLAVSVARLFLLNRLNGERDSFGKFQSYRKPINSPKVFVWPNYSLLFFRLYGMLWRKYMPHCVQCVFSCVSLPPQNVLMFEYFGKACTDVGIQLARAGWDHERVCTYIN